ncbi:WD40/YVTN/BNR-like repeat-containing protein [Saccharibacillus kuerlensis]|uniref:Sortilin N-terminal domain-containing protein n=1 Tax=Saccharibacillus kuerlensis TaxID=459527 RepID=A0ABQ2L1E0_9BACL|nr:hypothetical protein [Saccharibacillus kuerlensis]GGN97677.1 hypothetical protein GCM10010969_15760 [Saccharibacillus kuerlensis]
MNIQRCFSKSAGWIVSLVLTGSLIAGCSVHSDISGKGTSPMPIAPSSAAYETFIPEAERSVNSLSDNKQSQEIYLNDSRNGWKIEFQAKGNANDTVDGAVDVNSNTLYRTGDGGATWKKISSSTNGSFPEGVAGAVRFTDEQRGWVSVDHLQNGDPGLYETFDGGKTWTKAELKIPTDLNTAWFVPKVPILFEGTERGLYIAEIGSVSQHDEDAPLLFYVTSDGGASWSDPIQSEQGEQGGLSWKTERLSGEPGRSWAITIDGRTWKFQRLME